MHLFDHTGPLPFADSESTNRIILFLLSCSGISLSGKHAVVIGHANIVGRPVAQLLLRREATVSIAHSQTRDLQVISIAFSSAWFIVFVVMQWVAIFHFIFILNHFWIILSLSDGHERSFVCAKSPLDKPTPKPVTPATPRLPRFQRADRLKMDFWHILKPKQK
jgi:hypothetical protein